MSSNKRRQSSGQDSGLTPEKKIVPKVTTPTTSLNMEQKIDTLLEMMRDMRGDIKDIKTTLTEHQKAIEYAQKDIEDLQQKTCTNELTTKELREEVSECKKELLQCKVDISKLQDQVINQEAYSRRENLIFLNVPEEKHENCAVKISKIITDMGLTKQVQFTRVHRLGKYRASGTRPVIARFHYGPDREKVWKARAQLKGTDVVLKEDYPGEMEKSREVLRPIHQHAQFLGKTSKLVRDVLIIDNEKFTVKNINKVPEELQPRSICEREVSADGSDYLLFFGKDSPLSNWHPAKFTIQGREYSSVEQYYMYRKAVFAKDTRRASDILKTTDTRTIKKIGKNVNVNKQAWEIPGTGAMEEALRAKFSNKELRSALLGIQAKCW